MEVFLYLMIAAGFYEGGWSFSTSIVCPYGLGIKLAQWRSVSDDLLHNNNT